MMKNESGRSMVEMLGVLAIIGVFSVGGIAGYTILGHVAFGVRGVYRAGVHVEVTGLT